MQSCLLNHKPGLSATTKRSRTFHSPAPLSPELRGASGAPGHVAVALQLAAQGGRPRLEAAGHQEGGDALQASPTPPAWRPVAVACPACDTEQFRVHSNPVSSGVAAAGTEHSVCEWAYGQNGGCHSLPIAHVVL